MEMLPFCTEECSSAIVKRISASLLQSLQQLVLHVMEVHIVVRAVAVLVSRASSLLLCGGGKRESGTI